jgi:hypothetical protein
MKITSPSTDPSVIEARLAARLAGGLTMRAADLPHDVSERLRFAREQALGRAREMRRAAPAGGGMIVGISARGAATLGGFVPWWTRAASVLPLLVLVAGLVMIDRWSVREQVLAAADFDSQLLSDSLPPTAYSDPGFAEFLRSGSPP